MGTGNLPTPGAVRNERGSSRGALEYLLGGRWGWMGEGGDCVGKVIKLSLGGPKGPGAEPGQSGNLVATTEPLWAPLSQALG